MSLPLGKQIKLLLDEMTYDKERLTMAEDLLNEAWCHISDQELKQKISDYLKENILSRQ
jgi:inorganic triphosphatase YgiF